VNIYKRDLKIAVSLKNLKKLKIIAQKKRRKSSGF